jgi:choline transport protein
MVANEKYRQGAAFTVGWLNVLAWLFGSCAAVIYPAQLTMQVVQMYDPSFTYERWQIWLLYVALLTAGTAIVIYGHALIARVEILLCWSSLLAFFTWVITLCAASHTKASARSVFIEWQNTSGWPNGYSFVLDVGQGMGMYEITVLFSYHYLSYI